MDITPASLLTTAGAIAFAVVIRQAVEVLKAAVPALDARVSGALQAFAVSFVVYAALFATGHDYAQATLLLYVTSWVTCATAALGVNALVDHVAAQASPPAAGEADAGLNDPEADPDLTVTAEQIDPVAAGPVNAPQGVGVPPADG